MKKSEFIDTVAERAEMSRAAAAKAVQAIFDTTSGAIADAVRAGENLSIPGFGKFTTKKRAARKGRNPQTGKEITIPERTVVRFSPGRGLSNAPNTPAGARRAAAKKSAAGGGATAKKSTGGTAAKKATGGTAAKKSTGGAATAKKGGAGATAKKGAGTAAKKSGGATAKRTNGAAAKKSGGGAAAKKSGGAAKKSTSGSGRR